MDREYKGYTITYSKIYTDDGELFYEQNYFLATISAKGIIDNYLLREKEYLLK
jgi:hypothetical protein